MAGIAYFLEISQVLRSTRKLAHFIVVYCVNLLNKTGTEFTSEYILYG